VCNPWRDLNVLASSHPRSLTTTPDKQNTRLNNEQLLLQTVGMHRPAVGAYGGLNVHSPNLLSGIAITLDPHPESFHDPHGARHGEKPNPASIPSATA
jgi:hypothetical protein